MNNNDPMKLAIQAVIITMMDKIMDNVTSKDPFLPEKHHASKPLYAALVPDEIFKGSHFERRFVTPFGNAWEKLALVTAQQGLGYAKTQHLIHGRIKEERLRRITEVLNNLEHSKKGENRIKPDWAEELAYILAGDGEDIPVQVNCDLFAIDNKTNERYAIEIKAPLPNSDQTKVSKEKLLKLVAMEPKEIDFGYFALPYNPYGKKENYTWSFPSRWFNMKEDEVILIGNEFWDKLGGEGTYDKFILAVNEIGGSYKERIYREFLKIEPPASKIDFTL
jgi:Type II restriction endonuclease, TdeIII